MALTILAEEATDRYVSPAQTPGQHGDRSSGQHKARQLNKLPVVLPAPALFLPFTQAGMCRSVHIEWKPYFGWINGCSTTICLSAELLSWTASQPGSVWAVFMTKLQRIHNDLFRLYWTMSSALQMVGWCCHACLTQLMNAQCNLPGN